MPLSAAMADLLEVLPGALGDIALFVMDEHGEVVSRFGSGVEPEFRRTVQGLEVVAPPGRASVSLCLTSGSCVAATFPADDPAAAIVIRRLLQAIAQREQLEADMESMNSSSLQLLEQVAMLGETLPRLSAGASDQEVAAMGLKALLVAAGVERAVYVRYNAESGLCDVLVHALMDQSGQAVLGSYPLEETLPAYGGVIAEVLANGESGVERSVPAGSHLGDEGSPESLARSQIIGVPVSYGSGSKRVLLGALLVMDKRRSSYSTIGQLGSQEVQVTQSFAAMLGAVLGARKVAELGKELSLAQAIQGQILPEGPASVAGFDLAGDYRTSGAVGGDYFDFVHLADGRTLVVIADVSGHNLASGMMMVSARATLRTLAQKVAEPARLFEELAAGMFEDLTRTERFITAAAVTLRPRDREVEIVNAGHNDLMIYRCAECRVERISSEGPILGFLPHTNYRSQKARLAPGDFVFLYTDGVTEMTAGNDEMFGEDRLAAALIAAADGSAADIVATVLAKVHAFRGTSVRGDDVTAIAIKAVPQSGDQT